jgi:REP element-mobilizing transposase RayT
MNKYKNKYRIAYSRAEWWDYSANAAYFITICTGNREYFFGEIKNGKMNLSNVGILADVFWHEIRNHSKNVALDAFVVIPNHIHGILILNNDTEIVDSSVSESVETPVFDEPWICW